MVEEPPFLGPAEQQAAHCWRFCGNAWAPERWAIYHALHQVDDWPLLIELMQEIQANV